MEITLKNNFGYELTFIADNVKVTEDIESRTYQKDESGKSIITLTPDRDIKTDVIEQFVSVLDDMIYYRKSEFDSSDLIKNLFDKLPVNIASDLAKQLFKDFVADND